MDLDRNYFLDDEYILPIVHSSVDYVSPVKFGDELSCEVKVGKIGTTSFELLHTLKNKNNISAKILTKHVVLLKKSFEKTPIPEMLKIRLKENQN